MDRDSQRNFCSRSHPGKAENKGFPSIADREIEHFEPPTHFKVLNFQGFQGVNGYEILIDKSESLPLIFLLLLCIFLAVQFPAFFVGVPTNMESIM